jgi:hypothetical protein
MQLVYMILVSHFNGCKFSLMLMLPYVIQCWVMPVMT